MINTVEVEGRLFLLPCFLGETLLILAFFIQSWPLCYAMIPHTKIPLNP